MNLVPVIVPGSFVQFPVLFHPSRLVERPLERVNPAAELVLRDHENLEIGRAPLQELTTQLFEPPSDRLLVPHVPDKVLTPIITLGGGGR